MELEKSRYAKRAMALFKEGYNCSQAVVLAFSDQYGLDEETAARFCSAFGGGLSRLREVCGSVSGMCMVAGLKYGYSDPKAREEKAEHYRRIQELAARFAAENAQHSIVCRELLGLKKGVKEAPVPEERTEEYYKKSPCVELVGTAAAVLEEYIREKEGRCGEGEEGEGSLHERHLPA